ncbi:MAG: galactokinase [Chitinophagaceae bacterium]
MMLAEKVREKFKKEFGIVPRIFSSPGRVNVIGEHTDYNDGFVLPAAIDKAVYIAIAPAESDKSRWISLDFQEEVQISIQKIEKHPSHWVNYILGVVNEFQLLGMKTNSFNLVIAADIPIGAGLSSSAALECASAYAINDLFGFGLNKFEMAKLAQRSENNFIGLKCGIMDMFASLHGKKDHVLQLDCRSLEYEYFPLILGDCRIVLLDTGVRHSLASSEYNVRRMQCEAGVKAVQKKYTSVTHLRDINMNMLEECRQEMEPLVFTRCSFVIKENDRVAKACSALVNGSLHELGQLMYASHAGLQNDYEVSCTELDVLVELAKEHEGVIGARMMGGGFGGCTINIVHGDAVQSLFEKVESLYHQKTGLHVKMHDVITGDGTKEIL